MKIAKFVILLFVLSFPAAVAAQEEANPPHPIDAALEKCLGEKRGTFPRAECYGAASRMWEKAVADDYRKLLGELSPSLRKVLIGEQAVWEKYRARSQNFVMAKYGRRRGSGYISARIILLMKPDRERALELEDRFTN